MPGQPPKYRLYLSDEDGNMPKNDEGFWLEFAALWETRMPDKNGNPKFSGKTGKGEQYVLLTVNQPKAKPDAPAETPRDVGEDVPF